MLIRQLEEKLRDHEVAVETTGRLPASLLTDRDRLVELLVSLAEDADALCVASDFGVGTPAATLAFTVTGGLAIPETAFEPFSSLPPGAPRNAGGRLRLPTARALARLLGGKLVREETDGAAALVLYLPVTGA